MVLSPWGLGFTVRISEGHHFQTIADETCDWGESGIGGLAGLLAAVGRVAGWEEKIVNRRQSPGREARKPRGGWRREVGFHSAHHACAWFSG